jgi:hypothetical protein
VTLKELLLASISFQLGVTFAVLYLIGRLRERVTKLEEWERLKEAQNNWGRKDGHS